MDRWGERERIGPLGGLPCGTLRLGRTVAGDRVGNVGDVQRPIAA